MEGQGYGPGRSRRPGLLQDSRLARLPHHSWLPGRAGGLSPPLAPRLRTTLPKARVDFAPWVAWLLVIFRPARATAGLSPDVNAALNALWLPLRPITDSILCQHAWDQRQHVARSHPAANGVSRGHRRPRGFPTRTSHPRPPL